MPQSSRAWERHVWVRFCIEIAAGETRRTTTGLYPAKTQTIEYGLRTEPLHRFENSLGDDMPLAIGKHAGFWQRHAIDQRDCSCITDRVDILVPGEFRVNLTGVGCWIYRV